MKQTSTREQDEKGDEFVTITFSVQRKRIPAFRSALMDIGDKVSDLLTKNLPYPKHQALTHAIIAIAALRRETMAFGYDEWYDR